MDDKLFDLYSDYLLSSFAATTATGLSALMDNRISHDQVQPHAQRQEAGAERVVADGENRLWRTMQGEDGVITIDDSIVEKPYTDENELICWHYDHAQGQTRQRHQLLSLLCTRWARSRCR